MCDGLNWLYNDSHSMFTQLGRNINDYTKHLLKAKDFLLVTLIELLPDEEDINVRLSQFETNLVGLLTFQFQQYDARQRVLSHLRSRLMKYGYVLHNSDVLKPVYVNTSEKPKRLNKRIEDFSQLLDGDEVKLVDNQANEYKTLYCANSRMFRVKSGPRIGEMVYLEKNREEEGKMTYSTWKNCEFSVDFDDAEIESEFAVQSENFKISATCRKIDSETVQLLTFPKLLMQVDMDDSGRISLTPVDTISFDVILNEIQCSCHKGKNWHFRGQDNLKTKCVFSSSYEECEEPNYVNTRSFKPFTEVSKWVAEECNSSKPHLHSCWSASNNNSLFFQKMLTEASIKDVLRWNPQKNLRAFRNGILNTNSPVKFFPYSTENWASDIPYSKVEGYNIVQESHVSKYYDMWFDATTLNPRYLAGKVDYRHRFYSVGNQMSLKYPLKEHIQPQINCHRTKIVCKRTGQEYIFREKVNLMQVFRGVDQLEILLGNRNPDNYAGIIFRGEYRRILKDDTGEYRLEQEFQYSIGVGQAVTLVPATIHKKLRCWELKDDAGSFLETPRFDKIFKYQMQDDMSEEEIRRSINVVKFLIGYAMNIYEKGHPLHVKKECFLYIYGVASSGKSLLGDFINQIFP